MAEPFASTGVLRTSGFIMAGVAAAFVALLALPAQAGFEWTPPAAPPKPVAAPAVKAMPMEPVDTEIATPMPGEAAPAVAESAGMKTLDAMAGQPSPVIREEVAAPHAAMHAPSPSPHWDHHFTEAVGFGQEIPLALALRQIVPEEYAYSFGPGVNMGLRISWTGGRPWNEVLNQALLTHGLHAVIAQNTVMIRQAMHEAATEPMPAPAIPPMQMTNMRQPAPPPAPAPAPQWDQGEADGDYVPSYPRRNPIPLMMKDNAPAASTGPQDIAGGGAYPYAHGGQVPRPPAPLDAPDYNNVSMKDVLDPHEIHYWQAGQGQSLRTVLEQWGSKAGVRIYWSSGRDYMLDKPIQMHGTFPDAVTAVLGQFENWPARPQGKLHPNYPAGPSVLVVQDYSA